MATFVIGGREYLCDTVEDAAVEAYLQTIHDEAVTDPTSVHLVARGEDGAGVCVRVRLTAEVVPEGESPPRSGATPGGWPK